MCWDTKFRGEIGKKNSGMGVLSVFTDAVFLQ